MDGVGNWFDAKDLDNPIVTSTITDMRRESAGKTWVPPDTVLNVNGTTEGCLEVTKAGLLHTKYDNDWHDIDRKPSCEYKACMTTKGKKCLFPYVYNNETHPDLSWTICSGLDVYRPWCPTKLGKQVFIQWCFTLASVFFFRRDLVSIFQFSWEDSVCQ